MGVYLLNTEMLTSCTDCPIGNTLCCLLIPGVPALWAEYTNAVREKRVHNNCPLIPLPEHGNLIDRDKLKISTAVPLDGKPYKYVHIDNIKSAPVIVPADKSNMVKIEEK